MHVYAQIDYNMWLHLLLEGRKCYVVGYCMYIMYLYACIFSCRIALLRIDLEALCVTCVL